MTVIVNDHGFAPEDTGAIAADLQSDFDPKGITAELLKQRSIRITQKARVHMSGTKR